MKKSKKLFFSFDTCGGDIQFHETKAEARQEAEDALEYYRNEASDEGWPEEVEDGIGYGKVVASVKKTSEKFKKDYDEEEWEDMCGGDFQSIGDFDLKEIEDKEAIEDKIREKIFESLKGFYYCDRVWEAWQYGTMREDDFYPAEDSEEMIDELVNEIMIIKEDKDNG